MKKLTSKELSARMSKRLAGLKISDAAIAKLADRILIGGLDIAKFDVCPYGICVDYFSPRLPNLKGVFAKSDIAHFEVFPYGIINWDRFHVRVGFKVNELAGDGRFAMPGR